MPNQLFEQGAYHESGHIVMAYKLGYTADSVTMVKEDPGSGFTKFDYGKDLFLIATVTHIQEDPSIFNSWPSSERSRSFQVALNSLNLNIAGPVAEALHGAGFDFEGDLTVIPSGPDLKNINSLDHFFSRMSANYTPDLVNSSMRQIIRYFKQDLCSRAIKHLAESILLSDSLSLRKDEIESSL